MKTKTRDPACEMSVERTRPDQVEHRGETYSFCPEGCREKFLAEPQEYSSSAETACGPEPEPRAGTYTFPMHHEVRQKGPGACPTCGMSLEPVADSLGADDDRESRNMQRQFVSSAVFTLPVLARALLDLTPKEARRVDEDGSETDLALGERHGLRPGEKVPVVVVFWRVKAPSMNR